MHDKHLISVEALANQIDQVILIDCRSDLFDASLGQQQYEAGHIPNAAFFALHDALSGPKRPGSGRHPLPDQEGLVQRMCHLGAHNDSLVVVYDAGASVYAARLWWLLRWCGHDEVKVLDGGYAAWVKAGYPSSTSQASAAGGQKKGQGSFSCRPSLETIIESDALLSSLESGRHCIVDARAAERWRGDVEPLDPVAGHIPGALNRPNTQNLRPDGRFKPAEVLREEWLSLMTTQAQHTPAAAGASDGAALVHSCGSGVSACHNLLAMRLAGLDRDLVLHPGSWSEWCADPKRPVARGDRP
ncbi:MAG: sulfurtransferase [Burkholderiaceae bacterium]|jgi:thiosulfate/3-mercaptopyruvate sulfurtransferase